MRLIRLISLIGLILLLLAMFLLRSKPDSPTPTALQLNQTNSIANSETPASTQAAIQGPQKPTLGPQQILPPAEPLKIQQITPVKYAIRPLKQDVIEIGTERHSPPKPYLKLNKWEGEVNLKVSIPFNTSETPEKIDGKLRYKGDGVKIDFYPKAPEEVTKKDSKGNEYKFTFNEEGGVEFDTILDDKPADNKIIFPLETKGLKFYYQPPLNEENKDPNLACTATECNDKDGNIINFRPEEVVGSYAVYHESKQGDYSKMGGKNYKAGKAFHIYRPKIKDAQENEIWGELKINEQNNTLTITVDQKFLDEAVYPITIDPNFGYTTAGSSDGNFQEYITGSKFTLSEAGDVTSISAYLSAGNYGRHAIYNTSYNLVAQSTEDTSSSEKGVGWRTYNISTSLSAADYWLVTTYNFVNNTQWRYYDTGSTNQGLDQYSTYTYPFSFPSSLTSPTLSTNKFSIYATYTVPAIKFNGIKMQGIKVQ